MQGSLFIGGIPCYSIKGVSGMYPLRIKFGFFRKNPNLMVGIYISGRSYMGSLSLRIPIEFIYYIPFVPF